MKCYIVYAFLFMPNVQCKIVFLFDWILYFLHFFSYSFNVNTCMFNCLRIRIELRTFSFGWCAAEDIKNTRIACEDDDDDDYEETKKTNNRQRSTCNRVHKSSAWMCRHCYGYVALGWSLSVVCVLIFSPVWISWMDGRFTSFGYEFLKRPSRFACRLLNHPEE